MSDEKPPDTAPGLPPATSANEEAPAAANAPIAPVELRCKCGAGPHAEREGFCANSHPLKGHGGRLSLKHGLYADQPIEDDVASMVSATQRLQVLHRLFNAVSREAFRYADAGSAHRLNARDQQQLFNMVERLGTIDGRLRELEAETPAASTTGEPLADWPKRLALHFAQQPDDFEAFIVPLLEADRARCGGLRASMWTALTNLDSENVPVWRGKPEDPDVVLL